MKATAIVVGLAILAGAGGVSGELISNGDFGNGLTGWSLTADTAGPPITIDTSAPPNPGNPVPCAHISSDGTVYGTGGIYQVVAVEAGQPYKIQADWAGDLDVDDAGIYRWAEIRAFSWDGAAVINSYAGDIVDTQAGTDHSWGWTSVSTTYTPTTGQVAVIVGGLGTDGSTGYIAADNIRVAPFTPANPLIFAPQIAAVTVDGDLSDWAQGSAWADFGAWYNGGLASGTRARYAWNDAGDVLYIGIESTEGTGLRLEVGGLMGNLSASATPFGTVEACQIALSGWTGGAAGTIESSQPWGVTTGVVAAYTDSGGTMTIEIATPIYSDWGDDGTGMDLVGGMSVFEYANVFDSGQTAADSQIADGSGFVYLWEKPVMQLGSEIRLLSTWPPTCSDVPERFKQDSDVDGDCWVTLSDFALLAGSWMQCSDPANAACDGFWEYVP